MDKEQAKKLNNVIAITLKVINEKRVERGLMPLSFQLVVFPSIASITMPSMFVDTQPNLITEKEIKDFKNNLKKVKNFDGEKNKKE